MSTLVTRISDLATRIGTDVKTLRSLINGNVADLSALTTTAKGNLVAAVNEVRGLASGKQNALGFTPENSGNRGQPNGYAALDGGGKVPASQLPAYVDDVLEFANQAALPATGTQGVLYVAVDTGRVHRWSGSGYVEIVSAPGSTDAVPEGSVNRYFTDARAVAALTPSLGDTNTDFAAVFTAAAA